MYFSQARYSLNDKRNQNAVIEEFDVAAQGLNNHLGETTNKIESIDGDETATCKQKVDQLDRIRIEFENMSVGELNAVKALVVPISSLVDGYDVKQLEDTVNSLERRQKEVSKRFERKLNALNKAVQNQDIVLQEIQNIRKWTREKNIMLNKPSLLGFEVDGSEKQLQNLKVCKLITSLAGDVSSLPLLSV